VISELGLRTRVAAKAGQAAAEVSRRLGRGEGSVIGGRVTLALDPGSLAALARQRTVALVSGTNGKTTTTSMLAAALGTSGPVVTNDAGSNMFGGMVGALSRSSAQLVVLETDEGHLAKTIEDTDPRLVLLLNLTRDQLDRVGEVRMQAARWRKAFDGRNLVVVANADDPMVVWAAQPAKTKIWVAGGGSWKLDSSSCPECGAQIIWAEQGNDWHCASCDLRRPKTHAELSTQVPPGSVSAPVRVQMPGEINKKNAAMAITASVILGADIGAASQAVSQVESPGGRFVEKTIGDHRVRLILAKNPAGWSEALRIVDDRLSPIVVSINARVQDGRDPSWLWDVPYEQLAGRYVVATGERGRDLAVRLKYAGVEHCFVADLHAAVRKAGEHNSNNDVIEVMGNYSAFQDYRRIAR
jgi:lipid II isoglutaminyl synthase (glutamine-hydrolysing)